MQRLAGFLGAAKPEARHATCPCCATAQVLTLESKSLADRVVRAPWSFLQQKLGGTLYHCEFCKVQFYDCRKRISRIQPIHEIVMRTRTGVPETEHV
jgi:hypothetical protein